jgi:putative endonuclease
LEWIKQALSPLIGSEAEKFARSYLEKQGLTFVCQNYRCRSGEIDLIMQDQDELVFVEVKFRSNQSHGSAIEYFHGKKQRKFISAVMHYLQEKGLNPNIIPHRIDLVGIDKQNHHNKVNWLKSV